MTTDKENCYKVKTEVFEGPLPLLLNLIEKRKLLINDISLAKVTDDFIHHVENHGGFPIADSADFILVASTLLLIKSKSLLPELELTEEEQGNIEDLERRLKIYKEIVRLGSHVKNRFGADMIFGRNLGRITHSVFAPDRNVTAAAVRIAIADLIAEIPSLEELPRAAVKKIVSLEEMIENLSVRIRSSMKVSFREFSNYGKAEKVNVIVSFLAMLELVKRGIIDVIQDTHSADIQMETDRVEVPRYG